MPVWYTLAARMVLFFCRHTKHRLVNYNYLGNIAPFLSSSMMTLLAIEPTIFSLEG